MNENIINYLHNLSIKDQIRMEGKDNVLQSVAITKNSENTNQKLMKDLIKNVEAFLGNKDLLRPLSQSLKRIFYHGLTLDNRVSDK